MATTTGLEPATEKLSAEQGEYEYEQKEDRKKRHDGTDGVVETADQIAQRIPIPVSSSTFRNHAK